MIVCYWEVSDSTKNWTCKFVHPNSFINWPQFCFVSMVGYSNWPCSSLEMFMDLIPRTWPASRHVVLALGQYNVSYVPYLPVIKWAVLCWQDQSSSRYKRKRCTPDSWPGVSSGLGATPGESFIIAPIRLIKDSCSWQFRCERCLRNSSLLYYSLH